MLWEIISSLVLLSLSLWFMITREKTTSSLFTFHFLLKLTFAWKHHNGWKHTLCSTNPRYFVTCSPFPFQWITVTGHFWLKPRKNHSMRKINLKSNFTPLTFHFQSPKVIVLCFFIDFVYKMTIFSILMLNTCRKLWRMECQEYPKGCLWPKPPPNAKDPNILRWKKYLLNHQELII